MLKNVALDSIATAFACEKLEKIKYSSALKVYKYAYI